MNVEEFRAGMSSFEEKLTQISKDKEKLINDFIESNKEFSIGDRVKNDKGQIGVVTEIKVTWGETIRYKLNGIKKDGTVSKISLHYGITGKFLTPA